MKIDLGKYLIEELNKEQTHKDRLAYCRLHWQGRAIFAPPRFQDKTPAELCSMPVEIIYYMNGKLNREEYDNLLNALSGMYSHHVWGMAMVGRTPEGTDCLRFEDHTSSAILSA